MKNFKNEFGVTGTPALLKAFKFEVENIGWKYDEDFTKWSITSGFNLLYFCADNHSSMKQNHFSLSSCDSRRGILQLPQQWDKAIQLASEIEEEVKVPETRYYKYRGSSNQSFTISKIYKLRDSHSLDSTFAFIDDSGRNNGWGGSNEDYFSPSTEAEFDAQELEFKKKELLEEAKSKYKEGMKVTFLTKDGTHEISGTPYWSGNTIWNGNCWGKLYENGQWATIVEDEFKVGDWYYQNTWSIRPKYFQISRIEGNQIWANDFEGESRCNKIRFLEVCRKATLEEIAKVDFPKYVRCINANSLNYGTPYSIKENECYEVERVEFCPECKSKMYLIKDITTPAGKMCGKCGNHTGLAINAFHAERFLAITKAIFNRDRDKDTIKIAGYKAEIKDNKIAFGCKKFSKEDLQAIKKVQILSNDLGLDFTFNGSTEFLIGYEGENYPISSMNLNKLIDKL